MNLRHSPNSDHATNARGDHASVHAHANFYDHANAREHVHDRARDGHARDHAHVRDHVRRMSTLETTQQPRLRR